jgi:pSer/pThr/pTyr-binding forkhead associated (FHA) protein
VKLSVLKRNQPIQEIDLGKEVLAFDYSETIFLVGRSKDCHVVLDDKQVSREHVRLIHKNGKWFFEKASIENACLYNGEDFTREELADGDSLFIGNFTINIQLEPSPIGNEVWKDGANTSGKDDSQVVSLQEKKTDISAVVKNTATVKPVTEDDKKDIYDEKNSLESVDYLQEEETIVDKSFEHLEENESAKSSVEKNLDNDDFNFEESTASQINIDVGKDVDSEVLTDDGLGAEVEVNSSYSLENIDSDSNDNDEGTKVLQSFVKVQLELFGEAAPYDKFLLEAEKTYIGRDASKCQIVLNESDVSTVHAVVTKINTIVTLEDLNSSNGTLLNGDRINRATLNHNDEFVIGGVTFTVKIRSDFLKEENSTLMPVDENQTVEIEEIVEIEAEEGDQFDALGDVVSNAPQEKSIIKRIWKDDAKRKKAIYVLGGLMLAWVMLDDDTPQAPAAKPKTSKTQTVKTNTVNKASGKILSDEEKQALSARYEIGKYHYYAGRYREALEEFQKIASVDPNFNSSLQSLIALSKEGLSKLEEQEKKRQAEQAAAEKKIKIKELVAKATEYVKDRRVELAQEIFNEIAKIDPENIEISRLKLELDDWQREKAKKELEEATKKKDREDKIEKLKPGKTYFLQKEWFKATGKLDDFLKIKNMDEDLIKEASDMLKISRDEIASAVAPLLGKAKSLMEGQDLKGAYEVYQQILKIEPSNAEALNLVGDIKDQLTIKARKIYREAIISESLSLFQDAKEKLQEVQQVSPVDSDYYKKATDKLKDYLD